MALLIVITLRLSAAHPAPKRIPAITITFTPIPPVASILYGTQYERGVQVVQKNISPSCNIVHVSVSVSIDLITENVTVLLRPAAR